MLTNRITGCSWQMPPSGFFLVPPLWQPIKRFLNNDWSGSYCCHYFDQDLRLMYCLVLYSDCQRERYLIVLSSPQNPEQNFNQTTVNSVIFQIWQYILFSLANSLISSGMKILLCKKVSIISFSWQLLAALWFPLCLYCFYKNTFNKIPVLIGLFFLLVLWFVEQWWDTKICLWYNFFFIDRKKNTNLSGTKLKSLFFKSF